MISRKPLQAAIPSRHILRLISVLFGAIFIIFLFISDSLAVTATESEMEQVCRNWLNRMVDVKGSWAGSVSPQIIDISEITDADLLLARTYKISPRGFVVVPVLKELPPVKAFSDQGVLEPDERHGMGALLRDILKDRIQKYIDTYGSIDARQGLRGEVLFDRKHRQLWDIYLQDEDDFKVYLKSANRDRDEEVGPLLTTAWHQTAPYNTFCPWGDDGRTVVWCVATALAQIMWYHQWPPAGFGHTNFQWDGDHSCGGSSAGLYLTANFSDGYDYTETALNAAEIGFETGMAYHVDYGVCYSIGYIDPIYSFMPQNFAYRNTITLHERPGYTPQAWFQLIVDEINLNQPIQYLIYNHMIVADGWAIYDTQEYYHMNYGWGGGSNGWYALDNLYCGWAGCDLSEEKMFTDIIPDKGIMFYADTIAGNVPLEINFTASSDQAIDNWIWDLGDGDVSYEQNPVYTYEEAGIYDVSLTIEYGESGREKTRTEYIYVLADTLSGGDHQIEPGDIIEVVINAKNMIPLSELTIPIEYSGDLDLTYNSYSVSGCRTELFQHISTAYNQPASKLLAFTMSPWTSGYSTFPYLPAGEGAILKLYFTVAPDAQPGQQTTIRFNGFASFNPTFVGSIRGQVHDYHPEIINAVVELIGICGDADGDGIINILDILFLINYLYKSGAAPEHQHLSDVNSDTRINILDVVYLINYKYKSGAEPDCP